MWKCKEWWYIQLTLGIWCGPLSQHPLPPARHQPHLLIPSAQTINQKKAKNSEMRFNSQQVISYCLGLCTQKSPYIHRKWKVPNKKLLNAAKCQVCSFYVSELLRENQQEGIKIPPTSRLGSTSFTYL